ncbi:Cof-type HAD-IIB family hydrolase [Mycoplasmoides pirum]|uniref:Cof-type HAD-IIB family hydrolase n=1 Tax=Mycoplasmoides pirum TaxID=2122 RepID=UPI0004823B67|nr:Cof-type HAD-IIB family hydrolase [Mycoplasmoides pirum]
MNFENVKNDVKYLLFDLDGTLINNERTLANDNIKIPKLLNSFNLKHSIITGRPPYMMLKEIFELQPNIPIVAANGAIILDQNKNIIYSEHMNQELVNKIINFCVANKYNFYLYTFKQIYTYPESFPHVDCWKEIVKKLPVEFRWKIEPLAKYNKKDPVFKFLVWSIDQNKVFNHIKNNFGSEVSIAKSTRNSIDIGNSKIDKGTGFEKIFNILNATNEQFMVFGDGGNDLPMFNKAKYSVAMLNAADFVKTEAKFITDYDNNQSGVYHFIKKIWN